MAGNFATMWFQYIPFSDNIKKRAIRYLLQRYLGQFFEEKLTLDQLTVDLYNGTGSVTDVSFDVQALNDLGEQHNVPFEFVDGYISEMSVSIPWASLLTDSSYVEVSGMVLTVQPKQREDSGTSMFESMWSSMSSSMQLAAECLKQNPPEEKDTQMMEGLEMFAQTIDSILSRVKVKFLNSIVRLEHLSKGSKTGVALEVKIRHMDYCDEAGVVSDPNGETASSAFSVNKFHFEGVSFYSDEFPAEARTFSRSLIIDKSSDSDLDTSLKMETKPVIIAKLGGRQEVRLKMKKGENIQGPKVDLELNLGSLSVFLSPRQLHLLLELSHGMAAPDTQDDSNVARCSQKPMEAGDFDKVEQQLMNQLHPVTTRGLHTIQGWSTAPLDDSDEEFLPVHGAANNDNDSFFSDAASLNASFSSSCSSYSKSNTSVSSHAPGHQSRKKKKRYKSVSESEIGSEESHLHVRLSSLAVVLLHEDVLTVSPETGHLTPSSLSHMDHIAHEFFNKLGLFAASGYGKKDFEIAKQIFLEACQLNHIRLLAAPVILESDEKRSTNQTVVGAVLTAACVELLECLVEKVASCEKPSVEYVELLKFEQVASTRESSPQLISTQPDMRVLIKRTTRTGRNTSLRSSVPHTDISILLQNCSTEVDMSIVDRISAVLNPQPLCTHNKPKPVHLDLTGICQPIDHSARTDSKTDLKITCPVAVIKLRFPIPDLRPLYDMDRPPWWKRNVRSDILFANIEQFSFTTSMDSTSQSSSYDVQGKELTLLFQEGETDVQVPIAYAQAEDKSNNHNGIPLRVAVKINPAMDLVGLEEECSPELPNTSASMLHSLYIESKEEEPSPFSSKRVVHESDTAHHTSQCDGEELVIPGDREEMGKFIETASRNAKLQIEISLPKANVHFPSKHIYEVIYNRLNTDLSLWSPSPQVSGGSVSSPPLSVFAPTFSMCKSAIQFESDSESDDGDNVFYPTWDTKPQQQKGEALHAGQSKVTVTLSVGQGSVSMVTNVKNPNATNLSNGHLQLLFKEVNFFAVTGYKGTPQHNYICAQINNVSLFHHSEIVDAGKAFNLKSFTCGASGAEVIYKTDAGALVHQHGVAVGIGSDRSADMLTVAVRSQVDDRRIKMMRVACGIRGATLRHRVTHSHHSWLIQLLDLFDVMDFPVAGYQPSQVILELHQHLWDCSVDYRPLNLPMSCFLSVGSLSISSNMAARTSCSTLRFIAEDAYLFISDKVSPSVELRLDYICVMDLGLFELSLRMSESPRVDLRASNNVVHIRTCSDSARLLAQLITYLASCGDLETPPPPPTPGPTVPSTSHDMSASTVQRVHTLMEDAMIDDIKDCKKSKSGSGQKQAGVEVFLFPDETVHIITSHDTPVLDTSDTDSEEFVMVEHSGLLAGNGIAEVRVLTGTPIVVIENHFCKPTGKTDFLKAPLHFPAPIYKYTLREMTLVWHMYGGVDFKTNSPPKKHVTIYAESESTPSSPAYKRHANVDVNYSKTCPHEVNFNHHYSIDSAAHGGDDSRSGKQKSRWWTRGGLGRQHDVLMELQLNKVRFQHEVYPDNTTQASRQVLLIHEVDIRDRLAVSKINKFLYQYTSESRPRQSHANMVVVKATHLRPDPQLPVQECCLRVSLLPLRLNIDQDSLLFLITFANEIAGFCEKEEDEALVPVSPKHMPPVMGVDGEKTPPPPLPAPSTQLLIMLNDPENTKIEPSSDQGPVDDGAHTSPIFFRRFEFTPEVPIRLDYEGKHVDMKHGPLAGLLMGLAQLSCSELRLKRLSHRHGLLGFEKLLSYVMSEWLSDIKKNQLPSLLGGVGPMYSVVQLFQGIRDLFWLPIEQYQKDGRIVRGLQRGANSFTTSTAMAALELTTRIVHAIQSVAETAFDMVSPGPSVRRRRHRKGNRNRSRYTPPADFREGVTNAMALVKEGIGETAHTLVQEALAEHEDKGAFGAVGGVLRQIPPTMVAPFILASAATSNVLGGVRSQLVPDARREAQLKWRDHTDASGLPPHIHQ